jgi:hypothetical protein
MKKLKITKCKWRGVKYAGYYEIQPTDKYGGNSLIDANVTPEADDNVILCCDAGNTYQKCGLLPSELLKQRDDLLEAIYHIRQYWNRDRNDEAMHDALWEIINTTDELLDSIEKQENK